MSFAPTSYGPLAVENPPVAAQWHPRRNPGLTPFTVTAGSDRSVWWRCRHGHEWRAKVRDRFRGGTCPYCAGRRIWPGFNDLATIRPDLARQWQAELNGTMTASSVSPVSRLSVWWQCGQGHQWRATVANRAGGSRCPYCEGRRVDEGRTDLAFTHPDLAEEWHPVENGLLTPTMVAANSVRRAWWLCLQGHEWEAQVCRRTQQRSGCRACRAAEKHATDWAGT